VITLSSIKKTIKSYYKLLARGFSLSPDACKIQYIIVNKIYSRDNAIFDLQSIRVS
jgi:hypothetical protein